jgi:exodeoxyribonuclease V alpha subunit
LNLSGNEQSNMVELALEVDRVTYRNDDNGWTVLRTFGPGGGDPIVAVGYLPELRAGQPIIALGAWSQHKQYGKQFQINRFAYSRPETAESIEKYLASGALPGVGPKTAEQIIRKFGAETLNVLDRNPEKLKSVHGLGKKRADLIIQAWQENRQSNEVMMFLHKHGLSSLFATKIHKLYGRDAIEIVNRDPYRLALDIPGIGFVKADRIAQSIGIAPDSAERIRAAALFLLQQSEERGDCFLREDALQQQLAQLLTLELAKLVPKLIDSISQLENTGSLISEKIADGNGNTHWIYQRSDLHGAEVDAAARLHLLVENPLAVDNERVEQWLDRYNGASPSPLSSAQLEAVRAASQNRVMVLTGGPGVGKTTTANTIIRLLRAMGKSVALCAPTGRAAQRLTEVSGVQAKTIHRLLEWQPKGDGFVRNEHSPLVIEAVICDEASMLDIRLASALVRAVPKNAQLIFIGDADQLPSVGPGNFLADIIESGTVPTVKLKEVFRQASKSRIIQSAHAINQGNMPVFSDDADSDCWFVQEETPDATLAAIRDLLTERSRRMVKFDPIRDIQILTPMNRGALGTYELNLYLQELLNPKLKNGVEYKRPNFTLRPGDKVIQSSNNYELMVFNGDIGFVRQAHVDDGKIIVQFQDRSIAYDNESALDLRLAYAITIHKAQGSEFPAVIIPVSTQHYVMLQRNLIYTGLTRAKNAAVFIGTTRALRMAVENQKSNSRQTRLVARLQERAE